MSHDAIYSVAYGEVGLLLGSPYYFFVVVASSRLSQEHLGRVLSAELGELALSQVDIFFDGQEKIFHVEFDVEHFFLTHVKLRDGHQHGVREEASQDLVEVIFV